MWPGSTAIGIVISDEDMAGLGRLKAKGKAGIGNPADVSRSSCRQRSRTGYCVPVKVRTVEDQGSYKIRNHGRWPGYMWFALRIPEGRSGTGRLNAWLRFPPEMYQNMFADERLVS